MPETTISGFANLLHNAKRIAVLTGAGMSTESGIPDFRSSTGVYNTISSEEIFDIDAFYAKPEHFYKVMGPFLCTMSEAMPNPGHLALASLEQTGRQVTIATQNIDGLHQLAKSSHVAEVHGTLSTMTCLTCGRHETSSRLKSFFQQGQVPHCPCGGIYKPDITFYGESLPQKAFMEAVAAFQSCDLALILGTSLAVYPAASLPSLRPQGTPVVVINKSSVNIDATLTFSDAIGKILPQAVDILVS